MCVYRFLYIYTISLSLTNRNVSSAGIEARQALRLKDGVVEALLYLVRGAIDQNHMDNKSVENVVCVLRNLSYRCEEVVNPNYDKQPPNAGVSGAGASGGQTRAMAQHSGKIHRPHQQQILSFRAPPFFLFDFQIEKETQCVDCVFLYFSVPSTSLPLFPVFFYPSRSD